MEVILRQDMENLGYEGDVVDVKAGYARNFLIPRGIVVTANKSNLKMAEENQRQAAHKREKLKAEATEKAQKMEATTIKLPAKTGTSGKIFGTITTLQIANVLQEKGFDVDRKKISLDEEVKNIGTYTANVNLHREVTAKVSIEIIPEEV